jgi:hypothetical protein
MVRAFRDAQSAQRMQVSAYGSAASRAGAISPPQREQVV